jgi:hypothetical protein
MQMARHELLDVRLNDTPSKWVATLHDEFRGVGKYPADWNQQGLRSDDLWMALSLGVMKHLEYPTSPGVERRIHEGVDVAIDYFFGTWWKESDMYGTMLDKRRPDRDLIWFTPFSCGLLLALLSDRMEDAAKLCSWVEPGLKPEYLGGELEDEVCGLYMCMASRLLSERLEGIDDIEESIKKCRARRPRLLYNAWRAASIGDQTAFNKGFKDSMQHFAKKYHEAQMVTDWIAQHQSVIWLIAKKQGLTFPPLSEKLAAMVISRESLGFEGT